jgi:hypothetical protein
VANAAGSNVTVIKIINPHPANFNAAVYRHITTGAEPWNIVASPDGKRIFVANNAQDAITAIDAKQNVVGLAVLVLRNHQLGRRGIWLLFAGAIIAVGLFVALSGDGNGKEPVAASASATGTLAWRVEGWSELVTSWSENPANWFVGEPLGSSFARKIEGFETTSHPHNFYIETMLRTGIAGLLAVIAGIAGLLRRLWRMPARVPGLLLGPDVFPALLTLQLVWFITWQPGVEQGLVIGLAMALAISLRGRVPLLEAAPASGPQIPRRAAFPPGPAIQHLRQG